MKTLDEVIKAWSICFSDISRSDCTGCPYADEDGDAACFNHDREDALHYLKEYRNKEMFYNQSVDHMVLMMNEHEDRVAMYLAEMHKNNPLTWSELKQMEGKPVWVEALLYKQWAVIAYIGDEYIRFEGANLYAPECRTYMGADNGWKAYRKERSCT